MDENENTPNPDAEQAPGAGDAADRNPAAEPKNPEPPADVDDDQDDAGPDVPDHARAVSAGLRVDEPGSLLPGSDPHAVKVGTDDQGADVYAHHDAAGARFAL